MTYREIPITIILQGWFPDIYDHNKPKGMSDESYVNAIMSSWLMEKDKTNPIPKTEHSGGISHE